MNSIKSINKDIIDEIIYEFKKYLIVINNIALNRIYTINK
jgi:hypothetical protein